MAAIFNKNFRVANESKCRYKVMLGSAGSGKSVNTAQDYIVKLSDPKYKGCSLLVVRGSEVSHLNSTYAELLGAVHRLGLLPVWQFRMNPLHLRNKVTGNMILFRGCNDARAIERLKSVSVPNGKITWVWIEEATEIRHTDFEILDDRLRGELPPEHFYQITLTFNPINAMHWIKHKLWDWESPDIFKHKSTYLENSFIDEAYKQRMRRRKETDPDGYNIYGLGNWGEVGGVIFPNYHVGDYLGREYDSYSIGVDWGWNHDTAILLVGWKDGHPYVLKEVVHKNKTSSEMVQLAEAAGMPKDVIMHCDSAEPDRITEFRKAGFKALPVVKESNSILNQINWLKNVDIHIDGRCENTIKEIVAYKWAKDHKTGEYIDTPVCVNDDCMAALRYSIEQQRKARPLNSMSKLILSV